MLQKVTIIIILHTGKALSTNDDNPLIPWFIAESEGKLLATHCDHIAGLAETFSHVAPLLWAITTWVKKRESLTVTQKSGYWEINIFY